MAYNAYDSNANYHYDEHNLIGTDAFVSPFFLGHHNPQR
jgi:hypothetical protein